MTLHVWTADKEEWVVAESAEDACAVYCAHLGCEPATEAEDSDWGTHPDAWTVLPDDDVIPCGEECPETPHVKPCPRQCDDDFIIHTRLSCAEYVAQRGRSYLFSSNY